MQNISINFQVPQGWHELGDKQLRYVYQLLASDFSADEIKTLCLLQWSDTKVIGKQPSGAYLLRKGKALFEATPLTIAELLPALDWLSSLPNLPVRMSKVNRRQESKRETKMKWTGTKADLYEKIYGDYLMGSFNNGKATLAELVSHHGEIYGMALTEEECYQTLRRMKGRRGKDKRPYHDHTFKIHSRTYYISEAAWRLNELMRKHEDGDGRRTRTEIKPYPGSTMI